MNEQEIREKIIEVGKNLVECGLVQGTWGNISMRLDDKRMIVTPSGMDYFRLSPADLIIVDIETLEYNSPIKPTSEKKIHAAVYRIKPEMNAVIHCHPWNCSTLASARVALPAMTDEMRALAGGEAPVATYGLPGTKKLTAGAAEAMAKANACLMANHGMLVCGKDMTDCYRLAEVMEECAGQYIDQQIAAKGGDIEAIFSKSL